MSASPVGRYCACSCGASIDHRPIYAKYTVECAARQRVLRDRHRVWACKPSTAVTPRRDPLDPPREPNLMMCKRCCDIPWARAPRREADTPQGQGNFSGVVGFEMCGRWLCKGCGEVYAPEAKPENCVVLSSSAGMTERAAQFHGIRLCATTLKKKEKGEKP